MNICEKCGLAFYGKEDQALCGGCRRKDGAAPRTPEDGKGEKKGFWRRWWAKHYGAGRG
jgi:hypothetical protein